MAALSGFPRLAVLTLANVLTISSSLAAGDPNGIGNLAIQNLLTSGQGIAKTFAADQGIESHSAVIFAEQFESPSYSKNWDEARNKDSKVLSLVATSDSRVGKRALRVTSNLAHNTGGGMTKWFKSAPTIYIRFYTRFDSEVNYIHHFCTLRANKGLKGGDRWSGFGGAGIKPVGNERFSTALEPWGNWGKSTPPGKWNFYSYWHQMTPSGDGKFWGNAFRPSHQAIIKRGSWICAEFMLRHNTPGKNDGEQAYWIDGELVGHWKGINWRTSKSLWANAFTLESYVTDRWTKQKENIVDFDNVVIATEYIGPTGQ